jgi:hypothetical protein
LRLAGNRNTASIGEQSNCGDTIMQKPASVQPAAVVPVVRVLRLKRRRTNVPWIYSLYHAVPKPRRRGVREPWEALEEEVAEWDLTESLAWEGEGADD